MRLLEGLSLDDQDTIERLAETLRQKRLARSDRSSA